MGGECPALERSTISSRRSLLLSSSVKLAPKVKAEFEDFLELKVCVKLGEEDEMCHYLHTPLCLDFYLYFNGCNVLPSH